MSLQLVDDETPYDDVSALAHEYAGAADPDPAPAPHDAAVQAKLETALQDNDTDALIVTFSDLIHTQRLDAISPELRERCRKAYNKHMGPLTSGRAARGQAALDAKREKARSRFPFTWLDYVEIDRANDDFIKDLIAQRALILVYGPSGDGKTFWTIDLVTHAAAGLAYRSRRVRGACLVVYIAAEAGGSIQPRFYACRERLLPDSRENLVPLAIIMRGANLLDGQDNEILILQLREIAAAAGLPIGIVVFDTLSRSTPGGDEGAQHMTLAVGAADRIRDELAATCIFVHHSGKDAGKGSRGHSSLYAAADTVIAVVDRVATVEKSRNGMSGEQLPFDLEVVELGDDDDGDRITTCVVRHQAEVPPAKAKAPALTAAEKVCLEALRAAIADSGETLPQTSVLPGGVRGVRIDAWRGTFHRRYGEDRMSPSDDAVKKAFQRGNVALQAKGFIGVSNPWAWIC